jgi:carboxyl-terminal processing protease
MINFVFEFKPMREFKRAYLWTLLAVALLSASFLAGFVTHDFLLRIGRLGGDFPLLQQAHSILSNHAYSDLPESTPLQYGMIRGMLQAYGDPFTTFLEPVQSELEGHSLQGHFGGIGVRLGRDGEGFIVLFPFPEGPAAEAGVLEGDRLLVVDEIPIELSTPMETIQAAVRGPVGKQVSLKLGRPPDYSTVEVTITRREIALPSVTWHLEPSQPHIGLLEINIIAASTPGEIEKAVADLQERGATHFILDLRDNGGGLLSAGMDTARLFLEDGVVMQQQYRGKDVETFQVQKPGALSGIPLAVLINQNTASAAEIIAGALKAQGRAILVGTPSFGKDSIQLIFELQDGSSMHVTAAKWWVPGLERLEGVSGLQPDLLVNAENPHSEDYIKAAVQVLLQEK